MNRLELTFKELPYAMEESMNRLRVNVRFCGKNTRKILISSSFPGEGKSFVSVYLWKMLAEAGFPAVFVDVDLRKSVLQERHSVQMEGEKVDLGYYLSGQAEYEDVVYETNVKNGYLVPCFHLLENPSPLFEDIRFHEFLDRLSEDYRYVIVDTPPLNLVADGMQIAKQCDGAILVVKAGETSKSVIRSSLQQLEKSGCRILGTVLNQVEMEGRAYHKYYGKYGKYGKYYGKHEKK